MTTNHEDYIVPQLEGEHAPGVHAIPADHEDDPLPPAVPMTPNQANTQQNMILAWGY